MKRPGAWSRRRVLHAAIGAAGAGGPAAAQEAPFGDRGIGGTGVVPTEPAGGDRGIGGTGVIGTIRRFGSIVVNDLRITFPRTVRVRIDDRPARLGDLEIGHVVHVLAQRRGDRLATRLIEAFSEVAGPIEARGRDGLVVLGQSVEFPGAMDHCWRVGRWVAVSGLRRLDGTVVASLVTRIRPGHARVAGIPRLDRDGVIRIGALPILDLDPALVGRRLTLQGRLSQGRLLVRTARQAFAQIMAQRPADLSLEDYVALASGTLQLGSGLSLTGAEIAGPTAGEERAVVSATVRGGQIQVSSIRSEASAGPGRGRAPGRSPGPGGFRSAPGPQGGPGFGGPGPGGSGERGGFGSGPGGRAGPATGGFGGGGSPGSSGNGAGGPGGPSGGPR